MRTAVVVDNLALDPVYGENVLLGNYILGLTDREDGPLVHQDDAVRILGRDVNVVTYHYHENLLLAGQIPKHP